MGFLRGPTGGELPPALQLIRFLLFVFSPLAKNKILHFHAYRRKHTRDQQQLPLLLLLLLPLLGAAAAAAAAAAAGLFERNEMQT